jgi:hypothetical protein
MSHLFEYCASHRRRPAQNGFEAIQAQSPDLALAQNRLLGELRHPTMQ